MKDKIDAQQNQIINRLNSLLEIKYVYESIVETAGIFKPLLIVILQENCSSLTKELSSMIAKIFQEETDFLYRIFSLDFAQQQLKEENLFFVHGCTWDKMVFYNPDAEFDSLHEYHIPEKTLNNIQATFEKERHKMAAFFEGANFFIENNNLSHAAYMLHQYIELWFRYAALFIMGKERKSHSIKELQTYIKAFASELDNLFNTEIEAELNLLKLLDDAYITTRYENNYYINLEQINRILEKAKKLESLATSLFKNRLNACSKLVANPKEINIPKEQCFPPNGTELSNFIKSLSEKDFSTLKPYPFKKGLYTTGIVTEGYLGNSFMISNLLKVCIIAMEAEYTSTHSIPEPEHNIREVLGYVLDMIPHNEMELLDTLRYLAFETETNS
ncbi:HEPN domain-containing protein [Maribacter polysaccharolyticus]|uniref:HEPN domain-containing protein n=1 Tax=Maribacter polysaccharolyticus TaxID=3020831 RepID=UPI00237F0CD2|nr:HEPN domain-containing protein [Maribacter polysaccharolyticus]MDE3740212.1 HEPN domain-containing protein [Maribacter polysaccharolyticus]